jgi:DNA-binding NarL/FixJ family response regulator
MNRVAPRSSSILVIHDDPLLCAGVVASLSRFPCFAVFADTGEGAGPPPSEIDVVVADYASAVSLGDSRERAARGLARARILALTANDREVDIRRAIQAGIHGYVLVGGPLSELVEAVSAVADGVRYLCRAVAQRMADSLTHASLTLREVEVLELVVDGESNKAIARRLEIEVGTVKSHMSAIMAKLGATSRTQAASIAASRGLIEERSSVQSAPFAERRGARQLSSSQPWLGLGSRPEAMLGMRATADASVERRLQ